MSIGISAAIWLLSVCTAVIIDIAALVYVFVKEKVDA